MKRLSLFTFLLLSFYSYSQTCNLLNHNASNTVGLNTSGITSNGGSTLACSLGDNVLYSSSSNAYIATGSLSVPQGKAVTLNFDAKKSSSYFSTCEIWVHVGGYCNFQVYTTPFNDNGWVQIGTFNPTTTCSNFGPFTVPSDIIGGQDISYNIVLKNASSSNWVSIDNICVSEIAGTGVPTSYNEDFGTSSSGWYPSSGYVDVPYHTYKNASDAYVLLGSGEGSFPDKAAYFYTGFDFCSTVSGTGIVTQEINTSSFTNGEIRLSFKSQYPCAGPPGFTFDEDYTNYSPEVFIMQGPDDGSNVWVSLPVNYYFADYAWRVASYDISAYKNANVRIKIERGGFCSTAMEAVDNIKIIDRDCSISLLSCGTITGEASPAPSTNYPYSVPTVLGATYYKWFVRDGGNLYDTSPYIVSGQGTTSPTINFNSIASGARVLCIPYDTDPSIDPDACYAKIGLLSVTVTATTPLTLDNTDSTLVSCNGASDGSITLTVSGGAPAYTYVWLPNVSTTNSATGLAPNTYQITITDQNLDQIVETVVITEPNVLSITGTNNMTICDGDTYTSDFVVNGGTGPFSYTWTPATNVSNVNILNPNFNPSGDVLYSLSLSDANSCAANTSLNIVVLALPTVDVISNQSACPNTNFLDVLFTGTTSTTFDWTNDNTSIGLASNGTGDILGFLALSSGIANITVTPTDGTCFGLSENFSLTVYNNPVISLAGDVLLGCEPLNVNFTNLTSPIGTTCLWTFGDGNSSTGCSSESNSYSAGLYDVSLQVTNSDGCIDSVTYIDYITVSTTPSVDLGADQSSCDFITLDAGAGYDSYLWSTSETSQSINVNVTGDYSVIVSLNGCNNSDTLNFNRIDCTSLTEPEEDYIFIFPNPSNDYIQISNLPIDSEILLIDLSGKEISRIKAISGTYVLDIQNLSRGTYTLLIRTNGRAIYKKFVKV